MMDSNKNTNKSFPLVDENQKENDNTWFKIEQIETAVNVNGDMTAEEINSCRKKLIVMHQCGEDKEALIEQLKTMIYGLETNFDCFGS